MSTEVQPLSNPDSSTFDFEAELASLPADVQEMMRAIDQRSLTSGNETPEGRQLKFKRVSVGVKRKIKDSVFDLLAQKDLWAYSLMRVEIGRTELPLSYDHLGLSSNAKKRLLGSEKSNDGKRSKRVKSGKYVIFPELLQLKHKIEYFRTKIQTLMFFDGNVWLCDDEKMPEVEYLIEEWQRKTSELTQEVLRNYRESKQKYILWLAGWLAEVNEDLEVLGEDPLPIEDVLAEYEDKFPTYQQVVDGVNIVIVGPKRVLSLARQAEHNATLAEELVRLQQSNLEQEKIDAARRGLERDQKAKEEAIARGAYYVEQKMFQAVESLIELASKEQLTERKKEKIQEAVEQIQQLMQMPGASALSEFVDESRILANLCRETNLKRQEIGSKISLLQEKIEETISSRPINVGTGSRFAPTRMRISDED